MERENATDKLISIIIPVLNAEKYIEATLCNLFAQTYQNFEIIIAYDKRSTDNTLEILKNISTIHPLKIDQDVDANTGSARNRGFRLAKGEFVIFVDVDDEILPDYLSTMINVFLEYPELDIVCCGTLCLNDSDINLGKEKAEKSMGDVFVYNSEEAIMKTIYFQIPWGVWAHMMRRSFLLEHHLTLPDYTAREDFVYTLNCFLHTDKIAYSSKIVYLYLKHPDSITAMKFDKWWEQCQQSRKDLAELSRYLPQEAAEEILWRDHRLVAAGLACSHDYKTYRSELKRYGVSRLRMYRGGDRITGKISVIIFNLSKYLYYKSIRYMKKIR